MKQYKTGRVLATLLLGVILGLYKHYTQMRWVMRGKDAFLTDQGTTFDKFASYHATTTMLIAGIILAALAVGLYELIAAGITRMLPPSTVEE
jgi:hypothetical protein